MQTRSFVAAALLLGVAITCILRAADARQRGIPEPRREFRGVWVATVANIDWPSKPGLPVEQQKAELIALLDRCAGLKLNAIVLQVRPATDSLYRSEHEPWSEFLTGEMGKAPHPYYDPLAFAVQESHKRGLELHAWFNPYRARHHVQQSPIHPQHISRRRPELVREYGRYLWMDPGEPAVQEHSLAVMRDVVQRYDIDGVHIDDYFYPYKEKDAAGVEIDFPDEPSWAKYTRGGGKLSRDDWRRQNVDRFIERIYRMIKSEKRWVRFGISPFGIWRPGNPAQIKGFDQYAQLYADARKWLDRGWIDYFTPQLYWRIDPPDQSYPVLLEWWVQQNRPKRHLWPGNFTSKVIDDVWPASEIVNQVRATRSQPGATGNIHFSAKALMQNAGGISDALATEVYSEPALVPAATWLDDDPPRRPRARLRRGPGEEMRVTWQRTGGERVWLWVVQARAGGKWTTEILPSATTSRLIDPGAVDLVAVSAVDRCGNKGQAQLLELEED